MENTGDTRGGLNGRGNFCGTLDTPPGALLKAEGLMVEIPFDYGRCRELDVDGLNRTENGTLHDDFFRVDQSSHFAGRPNNYFLADDIALYLSVNLQQAARNDL